MDVKRLLTRGGKPFAAEIVDGTENYMVFLEALGNSVILPELIKSGWKLTALPLSLSKNGTALMDLPKMEYSPSVTEEQDMYDMLGTEMPLEERKMFLSTDEVQTVKMAAGNYTIQTREDFLHYLDETSNTKMAEDFLPINYFVHPAALFSFEEYKDPANRKWVSMLDKRRHLSMAQFDNFRRWAVQNGLKPDFSAQELLSFYFQWGICGLNVPVLSKRTVEHYVMCDVPVSSADATNRTPFVNDFGLVDRFQREYRKPGTERYQLSDPKEALRVSQLLTDNNVAVVRVRAPIGELVEEWETMETNISFNPRYLMVGNMRLTSLKAKGKFGDIHPRYWNPSTEAEMNNDMFLRAMAADFIEMRKVKADVSSYRALCEVGCSPLSALVYMKDVLELDKADPLATDEEVLVTTNDIVNYLRGNTVPVEVQNVIEGLMDGSQNIDAVQAGITNDASQNADKLYTMLYCANHILNIPSKDIYVAISKYDGSEPLSFTNGEITLRIPSEPIDAAYRGFKADKAAYRKAQVEKADNFMWVDTVARELGPESATRHVGVRCYTAHLTSRMKDELTGLQNIFIKKVEDEVYDPRLKSSYKDYARLFAVGALFSGALRGFYTFPKEVDSTVVRVTPEQKASWRKCIEGPFVDDTVSISDDAVYFDFAGDWKWYCVNAVIQPTKVTPRYGFSIKETSLIAAWHDYSTLPLYKELLQRNLLKAGDQPWSLLAMTRPVFNQREDDRGLIPYFNSSKQYLETYDHSKKFVGVPHILELQYPIFADDDAEAPEAGHNEEFKFKVGTGKILQYVDDGVGEKKQAKPPILPFNNLMSEDFFYTGGKMTLPVKEGKKPITVLDHSSLFIDGHEVRPADVENMDQSVYPISHLCGRRYLICDALGAYWTVEV